MEENQTQIQPMRLRFWEMLNGIRAMGAIVAYILAAIVGDVIFRAIEKVFELF